MSWLSTRYNTRDRLANGPESANQGLSSSVHQSACSRVVVACSTDCSSRFYWWSLLHAADGFWWWNCPLQSLTDRPGQSPEKHTSSLVRHLIECPSGSFRRRGWATSIFFNRARIVWLTATTYALPVVAVSQLFFLSSKNFQKLLQNFYEFLLNYHLSCE